MIDRAADCATWERSLTGNASEYYHLGPAVLASRADPIEGGDRIGFEAQVGVQLRLPVFGVPKVKDDYDPLMSDEPDF